MSEYGIESLQVLSPQEHVRRRPGMYIGETNNPSALFNEIIDNALDEQQAGYSQLTTIQVDYVSNVYSVTDYGRGFPQGKIFDPTSNREMEAVELLCTTAFSGGKFSRNTYKLSCFTGDTRIKLADGRDIRIDELISEFESGKDNYCYSVDNSTGKYLIEKINDVRVARQTSELCRVILDNGEVVQCTPDHKFLLREGGLRQAQDLRPGDSLLPGNFKKSEKGDKNLPSEGYDMIYDVSLGEYIPCHYLADEYNLRNNVYPYLGKGLCRHHMDFNKCNNNPTNIIEMTWSDHWKEHGKMGQQLLVNYNTSDKGRNKSREIGLTVGRKNLEAYVNSEEGKAYHSQLMTSMNKNPEIQEKQRQWMRTLEGQEKMRHNINKKNYDPEYQLKCKDNRYLKIASAILSDGLEVNEDTWNQYRTYKSAPYYATAIEYFGGLDSLIEKARLYNHKVVSVDTITLKDPVLVYDITIREGADNFLLSSGVFVKNCGLNGLGLMVTNSLSDKFSIQTWRDGKIIYCFANKGEVNSIEEYFTSEAAIGLPPSGSTVKFSPDPEIFTDTVIPLNHIIMRCKIASAFGMKTQLFVITEGKMEEIDTSASIYDLLPPSDEGVSEYYRHSFTVKDENTGEFASIALQYTSDTKSYYRGYTNLLYNSQGGTHHRMLDDAISEAWSHFNVKDIKSNDIYLGLRAVVAVFISDTEFSSQSKERLSVKKDSLNNLKVLIVEEIIKWLTDNEEIRESLIKRFQEYRASQNKLLARKEIKSLLYINEGKGGKVRRQSVVRKLRECESKSREGTELQICEGDSACGSMIQTRDIMTQAVLPIRGKILNVSRLEDYSLALKNEEIRSIINSIGSGIGESSDPDKSRYDKIIFYTDADSDGLNIRVLLTGIFINLLPNLVKAGMVYIAQPPLYGWKDKKGYKFTNNQKDIPDNISYTRYKGLGEMNPDELWESCMNPETRRLIKITYPEDINLFNSILTSSSVKYQMLCDQGVIKEV